MANIVCNIFILCIALQIGYIAFFFCRIFKKPKPASSQPGHTLQPVSVIICARNEASKLEQFLPHILTQQYHDGSRPLYEVIVVNDASTDHTADIIASLTQQYPHLKTIHVSAEQERTLPGKKLALSYGIAAAQNEFLLLTDADCMPASAHWLQLMTTPLHQGKDIAIGYGGFLEKDTLINTFIRWETLHTFLQYSTYAMAGIPYMAVGRNLGCTRECLLKAQQSPRWHTVPSGDDDLLIREAAHSRNTAVVNHPAAFTRSESKNSFAAWLQQKQRHVSTGKLYKPLVKALLGIYALSHALMWILFFILLFTPHYKTAIILLLLRCAGMWASWIKTACMVKERTIIAYFPVFDIAWAVYNFMLSPYIFWKNKQQWT